MGEDKRETIPNYINPIRLPAYKINKRNFDTLKKSSIEEPKVIGFKIDDIEKENKSIRKDLIDGYKKNIISLSSFYKKPVTVNYNQNILRPMALPMGVMFEAIEEITPENIGEFALPIVEFIRQTRPDFVIGVDRGARLFGLAVMMLYRELYGEFPTRDHKMHFRRISKSVPTAETLRYLRPDAERMHQAVSEPRILILDDWVVSGGTRQEAEDAFTGHMGSARVFWGVMRGRGADISGNTTSGAFPAWKDNPEILGLDYEGTSVRRIKSSEAIEYRKRMQQSIQDFAQRIKSVESKTKAA